MEIAARNPISGLGEAGFRWRGYLLVLRNREWLRHNTALSTKKERPRRVAPLGFYLRGLLYQLSRAPSWMTRGPSSNPVIRPKFTLLMSEFGPSKLVWLNRLMNSKRISRFVLSVI